MSLQQSPAVRRDEAARELIRRRAARQSLAEFTLYIMPVYQMNWHHRILSKYLDRLVNGEIENLMVFMPPQHGKSQLVSRHLPAFILGKSPDTKITAASYAAELIQSMNRDVQRLIDSPPYAKLFPETRINQPGMRSVGRSHSRNNEVFEVIDRRGVYRCAGVGGSLTGFPSDMGIIDDPYKDYQEAMSETVRRGVWEWYTSVFLSRTHVKTRKLITLTRWHEDDLAGTLLKTEPEKWTVLSLPAIREDSSNPDDPREIGEALWPEKFPVSLLDDRRKLNPHQFDALYQQRPSAREGAFFKVAKFGDFLPAAPVGLRTCRGWDLAATIKGDYTAGVKVGVDSAGIYYVLDAKRGQWTPDDRNALMRQTASLDGTGCKIRLAQDPGQAGVDQVQSLTRMFAGYSVRSERVSGSKEVRADGFAAQVNAGNVRIVKGDWNQDFTEELRQFPRGKHDDLVDAAADAFNELALGGQFSQGTWVR